MGRITELAGKCKKCGAPLNIISEGIAECSSCGTRFKFKPKPGTKRKLTTEEANEWLLQHSSNNPEYHSPVIDDELGIIVDAELQEGNGKSRLAVSERYGGMFWFGDAVMVFFSGLFVIALIAEAAHCWMEHLIANALLCFVLGMAIGILFARSISELKRHLKEKKRYKDAIKKGTAAKQKLKPGAIAYRCALFTFLGFFCFMLIGFTLSMLKIEINSEIILFVGMTALFTMITAFVVIALRIGYRLIKDGWR